MKRWDLTLPRPPSVNRTHRIIRNRETGKAAIARSSSYRSWREEAWWELSGQIAGRVEAIEGEFAVLISARTRGDIDNLVKPTLDFLQWRGFIANDKNARRVTVVWDEAMDEKVIGVLLEEL